MDTNLEEQTSFSEKKGDIFVTRPSETPNELAMSCVALKNYPKATFSGFLERSQWERQTGKTGSPPEKGKRQRKKVAGQTKTRSEKVL